MQYPVLTIYSGAHPQETHDLLTARGIPPTTLSTQLTLIEGSATDLNAIIQTLFPENLPPASMIISGVGGTPDFSQPLSPKFVGKTICQDTIRNILEVLREQRHGYKQKPVLMAISSTGLTKERDIPLAMVPLYNWMLKVPHADKRVMEELIFEEVGKPELEKAISDYVIIRSSFLTSGASQREKVRVLKGQGEGQNTAVGISCPFVGYTICREDVGGFMFGLVEGLDGEKAPGTEYYSSVVSISH